MPDLNLSVSPAFGALAGKIERMSEYLTAVTPALAAAPQAATIATHGAIVLLVAWHEHFLASLASGAIHVKQSETRQYLATTVADVERRIVLDCDLGTLITKALKRINLKNRASGIEELFAVLFGFSPWPNETTKNQLIDLNLLRQLIVHHGGGSLGDGYVDQLSDKNLLETRRYGSLPPVRSLSHQQCLRFLPVAFVAFGAQVEYLRQQLLSRSEWQYRPCELMPETPRFLQQTDV